MFAEHGANLVINGTNVEVIRQNAVELEKQGISCIPLAGDISQPETSRRLTAVSMDQFGRIDVLVNNSGVLNRKKFSDFNEAEWRQTLAINLDGMTYTCSHVLDVMVQQGHGKNRQYPVQCGKKNRMPTPLLSNGVSKAGGLYLTRHLALEYAPHNINVNAVCPGPIATEMVDTWDADYRPESPAENPPGAPGQT